MDFDLYVPPGKSKKTPAWKDLRTSLTEWLHGLQKPVAIYTWGSDIGRMVINLCVQASIPVPHEVAVLGGDDDTLLCNATTPPQSGIIVPAREIGRKAAKLLDDLMRGKRPEQRQFVVESQRISERASTDVFALNDRQVVQALLYLRENFMHPITISLKSTPACPRHATEKEKPADFNMCPSDNSLPVVRVVSMWAASSSQKCPVGPIVQLRPIQLHIVEFPVTIPFATGQFPLAVPSTRSPHTLNPSTRSPRYT